MSQHRPLPGSRAALAAIALAAITGLVPGSAQASTGSEPVTVASADGSTALDLPRTGIAVDYRKAFEYGYLRTDGYGYCRPGVDRCHLQLKVYQRGAHPRRVLGRQDFELYPGHQKPLVVKLAPVEVQRLRRAGSLRIKLVATIDRPGVEQLRLEQSVRLRAPRGR